ncbi:hypothetical protein [Flavobacterium sp.]|uniref:hypothetical protein n=1 Tax=Flavobacterium sp. TaxID=239 RepID=UPI003D1184F0
MQNYKSNDTILVVIGAFHKNDIEKNLRDNGYEIVQPNSYGTIEKKDIDANFEKMDSYAILSFNLLGMQSYNDKINKELVNQAFDQLKEENNTEINFLKIKYDLFLKKIDSKEAIKQYKNLLTNSDSDRDFTWNGVKNKSRIDSYFDPFGNLNVLQRIHLELLREYSKTSNLKGCQSETEVLSKGLNTLKNNMLLEYIRQYIKK